MTGRKLFTLPMLQAPASHKGLPIPAASSPVHGALFWDGKQTPTPRHAEFFMVDVTTPLDAPPTLARVNIQGVRPGHEDATLRRTLAVLSLDFHRMAAQASGEAT